MALAIALLIGGFVWLFAAINPFLSDFLGAEAPPTPTFTALSGGDAPDPSTVAAPTATLAATVSPSATAAVEPTATVADDTAGFQPDYEVGDNELNFRGEPGTDGTSTIGTVVPGAQLQSTGEEETVDGVVWLQFETEDGEVGWVREIDVNPL